MWSDIFISTQRTEKKRNGILTGNKASCAIKISSFGFVVCKFLALLIAHSFLQIFSLKRINSVRILFLLLKYITCEVKTTSERRSGNKNHDYFLVYCETCLTAGKLNKYIGNLCKKFTSSFSSLCFTTVKITTIKLWHGDILIRADCMPFEFVEIAVVMQFTFFSYSHSVHQEMNSFVYDINFFK